MGIVLFGRGVGAGSGAMPGAAGYGEVRAATGAMMGGSEE